MKTSITFFALLLCIFTVFAQDPAIIWQKTIGGSDHDVVTTFEATSDGGYIIGGRSLSNISGDKTENSHGMRDIWLVKIDATGNIMWQNTIGGNGEDLLISAKQTSDGGYIVGASSDSNISGDKTENSRGGYDYWILKLNASGDITWQKTYGGDQPEYDNIVSQTSDGGYFVCGYSDSGISGDKTEASNGQRDYWALKLDTNGAIVWQNGIGGNLQDQPHGAFQTADGGYMIGGYSRSGISGDKTEVNQGLADNWIVKLDANGSVQWDKSYGGNDNDYMLDMISTTDDGFLLGTYSRSNISGDKSENSQGDYDYWILKVDNSGNILWQNTIGGSEIDYLQDIKQLADGTFMISGFSNSNLSGDKTENSNGGYDYWLVRLDSSGNILSQNTIGGSVDESGPYLLPTADGNFIMACSSDSNISGDKGDDSKGLIDYWVFKTTPSILGVEQNIIGNLITVYPNPSTGDFIIDMGKEYTDLSVQIYNILGQLISSENYPSAKNITQEITSAPGVYFVTISTAKEGSKTLRIIKQ